MNPVIRYIRQSLQGIYPPEELRPLAMMICCDMLGLNAIDIYAGKDITLSPAKRQELENIVARMQRHEPVQYVCGYADFCGRRFHVEPGVLIPRPETAELTRLVVQENPGARRILDIGTGSGCIAVTLSKELPQAEVEAWDISEKALAVARRNNAKLEAAVTFRQQDILDRRLPESGFYDIIVSNPPYVMESEKAEMEPNVLQWEPGIALFVPDDDPLLFYRRIAEAGRQLLRPEGRLYLEINQRCGTETAQLLQACHYRNINVIKDIFKNERIITANR